MILYLYALADGLENVDGIAGVGGEPLVREALDHAILVAGWMETAPDLGRESLTAQDACVRALHARAAALLPMRFGVVTANVDAAATAVGTLGSILRERLDLVRGREQVALWIAGAGGVSGASGASGASRASGASGASGASRASEAGATGAPPRPLEGSRSPGRRYLEERAARGIPEEVRPIIDAVRPFARATRFEPGAPGGVVIATVYHLIDRGSSAAYFDAAQSAAANIAGVRVRPSGPSPAYAFADIGTLR